jgi:hypothetical protein
MQEALKLGIRLLGIFQFHELTFRNPHGLGSLDTVICTVRTWADISSVIILLD